MKMKRFLLMAGLMLATLPAWAWGPKGHDVVAYVAECHLSKKAAVAVDRALGGYSPVYWANWLDNASHTSEFAHTKTWHYMNIDEGQTIESMPREPKGDLLTAIEQLTTELKSGQLTPEQEAVNLKMLIHLVGDLHCPMHAGHRTDLGGNRVKVRYFGRDTNLHAIWDSALVESAHKWGYTEWQQQCDRLSKKEAASVVEGTPTDWFRETVAICTGLYEQIPEGSSLSYDEVARYAPIIENQLIKGGHRLAHLLNEIYK